MDVDKATVGESHDCFRFLPAVAIAFGLALLYLTTLLALAKTAFDPHAVGALDADQDLPRVLVHPGIRNAMPILLRNLPVVGISTAYAYGLFVARRWSDAETGDGKRALSVRTKTTVVVLTVIVSGVFARELYWNAHFLAKLAEWSRVDASRLLATAVPHAMPEIAAYFLPMVVALTAISRSKSYDTTRMVVVSLLATAGLLVAAALIEATTWSAMLAHVVPGDSVLRPNQP